MVRPCMPCYVRELRISDRYCANLFCLAFSVSSSSGPASESSIKKLPCVGNKERSLASSQTAYPAFFIRFVIFCDHSSVSANRDACFTLPEPFLPLRFIKGLSSHLDSLGLGHDRSVHSDIGHGAGSCGRNFHRVLFALDEHLEVTRKIGDGAVGS